MLAEACASLAAQTLQPKAHLIHVDYEYLGPGTLLNRMIDSADTEFISILPDDDLYDPDHLEVLAGELDEADIALSWGRIVGKDEPQYRGKFVPSNFLLRKDTGMRGCFMFRKSLWEKLGGWQDCPLEDWDFLCRAEVHNARWAPVYRETWTYRFHDTNCSRIYQAAIEGTELPKDLYHMAKFV
jgi:hypothetical protein